jgi:hypothetical protein
MEPTAGDRPGSGHSLKINRFHSSTPSSLSQPQQTTNTPAASGTSTSSSTIIIFGFSPEFYSEIVELFKSIGETTLVEPPPSDRNWISISYRNSWEAARAVRRNGEVLALSGGNVMIGVKWAVSYLLLCFLPLLGLIYEMMY